MDAKAKFGRESQGKPGKGLHVGFAFSLTSLRDVISGSLSFFLGPLFEVLELELAGCVRIHGNEAA